MIILRGSLKRIRNDEPSGRTTVTGYNRVYIVRLILPIEARLEFQRTQLQLIVFNKRLDNMLDRDNEVMMGVAKDANPIYMTALIHSLRL